MQEQEQHEVGGGERAHSATLAAHVELVAGGKLISPNIATIHAALKDGTHDLDCPYLWDDKPGYAGYPDSVAGMPEYLKAKIHAKKKNIGKSVSCKVVVGGCDGGTCG